MSTIPYDPQAGLFTVRLGKPDEPVDLTLLEQLAERLRGAFREIVREQTGDGKSHVRLLVRDAHKGSIVLTVQPELEGDGAPLVNEVARTLIEVYHIMTAANRVEIFLGLDQERISF